MYSVVYCRRQNCRLPPHFDWAVYTIIMKSCYVVNLPLEKDCMVVHNYVSMMCARKT